MVVNAQNIGEQKFVTGNVGENRRMRYEKLVQPTLRALVL
jgi:hypothetical protein